MKKIMTSALLFGAAMANAATGAGAGPQGANSVVGAVFAATNDVANNEVIMYTRTEAGALKYVGNFATGGRGEGGINDPLQAESSMTLTSDHKFLIVVNAGSSNVSVFAVYPNTLSLVDKKSTQGGNPVSVTVHDDLVYVANVGGTYHTAGFHLKPWGELEFIPNSKQPLSGLDTEPGAIAFSPDGTKVIVTERQTSNIDVFSVAADGSLTNGKVTASGGVEAFGARFAPSGALLVTLAGSGAVSSFAVNEDNSLTTLTAASPSSGAATCWVIPAGGFAFATSAITSSVSGYKLNSAGDLSPLGIVETEASSQAAIFPAAGKTAFPLDIEATSDNQFVYVVYSVLGKINGYQVSADGKTLTKIASVSPYTGTQIGVEGLAVY
jgi:6-phosphogluconolactonase (cycloisomerase 2 family)